MLALLSFIFISFALSAPAQTQIAQPPTPAETPTPPTALSRFDLMTDLDAFYSRRLDQATEGEFVSNWPIVNKIAEIGKDVIDAEAIANEINESFPIKGQEAFKDIQAMADECAKILGAEAPQVWIREDPRLGSMITRIDSPHFLVISSGMYERFKKRPGEFKFLIGREIGHIKCNHIRNLAVARQLMLFMGGPGAMRGISDGYVAPAMVGQLLKWSREAEISADRAGLLCSGAPEGDTSVAKAALNRLLHGTDAEVDSAVAEAATTEFENERFVDLCRRFRSMHSDHPFVPERRAALDKWVASGEYAALMKRLKTAPPVASDGAAAPQKFLVIDSIAVTGLPDTDAAFGESAKCDPVLTLAYGKSEGKTGEFSNNPAPEIDALNWRFPYLLNCKMIVEVRDADSFGLELVGTRMMNVDEGATEATGELNLEPAFRAPGRKAPIVTVKYRVEEAKADAPN